MKIKKIILGVAVAGLVGLTFSTTTYAWFKINSNAYVNQLSFKVVTGLGIKAAVDGSNIKNYKTEHAITTKDIESSILRSYNRDKYDFVNNKLYECETQKRYEEITLTATDYVANTYYILNEDNQYVIDSNSEFNEEKRYFQLVQKKVPIRELELEEIEEIIKTEILLHPVSSLDGKTFVDQYGKSVDATSGKYLEFDLYLKTLSDLTADNQKYGIYLTDDTTYVLYEKSDTDIVYGEMNPTSVRAIKQTVELSNNLQIYNEAPILYGPARENKTIDVDISNAIRFSYENKGTYEVSTESTENIVEPVVMQKIKSDVGVTSTIYEITNEDDLGSYATDYDGDDPELIKLYDYRYNAMYTYYDSLIPETSGLENAKIEPLNYDTLKALYDDKKITNVFDSDLVCAKVESGLEANLVTFRFWIEGFDADYFIGIPSSTTDIKVNLSFKVDTKDKLN